MIKKKGTVGSSVVVLRGVGCQEAGLGLELLGDDLGQLFVLQAAVKDDQAFDVHGVVVLVVDEALRDFQ